MSGVIRTITKKMAPILLFLVLLGDVLALIPQPKDLPQYVFGRPYGGFMNQMDFSFREDAANLYNCKSSSYFEGYANQPVDHFANISSNWTQFYQYNSKFYNGSSNLAFLLLGGEASIIPMWVCKDDIPYITLAKKYGAAVMQVEHRYFGRSRPMPTLTVPNLKWLTPEQTLADFNNFIIQMNTKHFSNKRMRWVLFGGSYPGTVASWMRVAYPNASIGAFSSSAAVNLVVDNYNFVVGMRHNYERINRTCASNIGAAFKQIQSLSYSRSGREQLEEIFNVCTEFPGPQIIQQKHLQYFWANILTTFIHLNQYSETQAMPSDFGMPNACAIMNNASEPHVVLRVRNVKLWVNQMNGEPDRCMHNDYDHYISILKRVYYDEKGKIAALRGWVYQTCSYLGYFQTTDGGRDSGIWGSLVSADWFVDQCINMFGPKYNLDFTNSQVKKYRDMFGGAKDYKGSKIVFTNGNMDPWNSLGLHPGDENQANQVFANVIDRGVHGAEMYPPQVQDSASLKAARTFIASILDQFIESSELN